ncbi:hypothetical protein [Spiroplasma poulsonii]|nr:hypothetical protein [Spiroplasma poulsonii]
MTKKLVNVTFIYWNDLLLVEGDPDSILPSGIYLVILKVNN